ncbi:MAG: TlpA family protein disulfide reductase [Candidatus Cyclonatronum sp.]|uniref:peroxiredoxin family protein n=1 Tax=Cyclonatronum sp. TaxID=3024185 RepID=UPI0025BBE303|nr:TlpA disulfide reductase family protein [Cyclonatronum sp.]MCH8485960.1 TlpA family protein disulfide reductase [Cyclonatronum sp.]
MICKLYFLNKLGRTLFLFLLVTMFAGFITNEKVFAQSDTIVNFTLEDLEGNRHSLQQYLDKGPVYISFFAMWCQPCLHKLRTLKPVWDAYREAGFTLLVINTDTPNSLSRVESYWRSQRYDMPLLLDPSARVFEQMNGRSLPYALMVAQDGTIVQVDSGFLPGDERKIETLVQQLLAAE